MGGIISPDTEPKPFGGPGGPTHLPSLLLKKHMMSQILRQICDIMCFLRSKEGRCVGPPEPPRSFGFSIGTKYSAYPWGYRDSLLATVREAVTIWYQGVPRWAQETWHKKFALSVCISFRSGPNWALSQTACVLPHPHCSSENYFSISE